MDEYFRLIEEKISKSGYPGQLSGEEIYDEICDQIAEKDTGSYLFLSKKEDDLFIEFKIEVMEDQFNLSYMDIHTSNQIYHIDFD